jgi:hypothetical protein
MTERRGRWHPSPEQVSLAIDCAVARMPIMQAAGLVGVKPRTLWLFAKRVGSPGIFGAWKDRPRVSVASRKPETAAPVPHFCASRPRKAAPDGGAVPSA